MLFVQPQRGTAPCRLLTAGLTELLLAAQEGEKKHDGMTGRQPRQDPQNSFAAQVGELNSFPLNLKIGLGSWNVSHLLLSASAAEKKPDEEVGERPTNDTGEPGPTPSFLRLCKTTFVTPASPSPFEQGESRPRGKPTPPEARESSSTTARKTMARSQVGSQVDTRLRTPVSCNSRPRCGGRFQTPPPPSAFPTLRFSHPNTEVAYRYFFFPPLGRRDPDRSFGSHLRW
ncbi:uncharacterized protein LOC132026061 isoform X1 [Mustela nigripes]|uniref:uncharacterized protein LOC132026061 isoform X1 n=1 Tax=Mustela nigripes TaxID=77151 RepID=UPI0028168C8C|nr:uncharacterized protein LOC132026061 isoform X1 [Mustela nigripes]